MDAQEIQVQLDQFDGPLALLLHLIQKQDLKISEIDINEITQQYLSYLQKMRALNFDIAGEYLYLAASLLYIKSNSCLVENELTAELKELADEHQNGAPEKMLFTKREELIERLLLLEKLQHLGKCLWELPRKGDHVFTRPKIRRKEITDYFLPTMDSDLLAKAMLESLKRSLRKTTVIQKDRVSIRQKLLELKELLTEGQRVQFDELLKQIPIDPTLDPKLERLSKVMTFISLLELGRLQRVRLFQNKALAEIYIEVLQSLADFDVDNADGFDQDETEDLGATV